MLQQGLLSWQAEAPARVRDIEMANLRPFFFMALV
jgi:hypothetical protein